MKAKGTRIWIKEWWPWIWKGIAGLSAASTVAATWWMFLTFETKADAKAFKQKYWENRTSDVRQVIDVDKRVDRLETLDKERIRRK